jgi:nucleoside phosphorylase
MDEDVDKLGILISEAERVAPSIKNYDVHGNYGQVTDEGLSVTESRRWEIEARTLIRKFTEMGSPQIQLLSHELEKLDASSRDFHSRSIFIHMLRGMLENLKSFLESGEPRCFRVDEQREERTGTNNTHIGRLRSLRSELEQIQACPWGNVKAWIAKATPIIRNDWPDFFDDFKKTVRTPQWTALPGISGNEDFNRGARAMEESENEAKAEGAKREILSFLEGLEEIASFTQGDVSTKTVTPSQANGVTIDVAILTVLPEEYRAVHNRLCSPRLAPATANRPNLYAWTLGDIPWQGGNSYSIALGMLVRPGTNQGALATLDAITRWRPRYVFFVGIAGGFEWNDLRAGDIVVADVIYGYAYGKLERKFEPRTDWVYRTDVALLTGATAFATVTSDWADEIPVVPPEQRKPRVLYGAVASGDQVVDDPTNEFFAEVIKVWPKLQAVEMEGVGAASAIEQAQSSGESVGFLMIRGISDMPRPASESEVRGTLERDSWKEYAADAAAAFVVSYISSGLPVPPHRPEETNFAPVLAEMEDRPQPELALKLFQLKRNRDPHQKIAFDHSPPGHYEFGLALENTAESTVAKGIHIEIAIRWEGKMPKLPILLQMAALEGWQVAAGELLQEQPIVLEFHGTELACPYRHPKRWDWFRLVFRERVNGPLNLHYSISSVEPYTSNEGNLRIVIP